VSSITDTYNDEVKFTNTTWWMGKLAIERT